MNILKPSAKIIRSTPDMYKAIEEAARTCYLSEPKDTPKLRGEFEQTIPVGHAYTLSAFNAWVRKKFINKLRNMGHQTPFEFADIEIEFTIDRGVSHEYVRHRMCSPMQECLSGGTEIIAYRDEGRQPANAKRWSLRQLSEWQSDSKRKGRLKLIQVRSIDKDGRIVPNKIAEVLGPKDKELFAVTTKSGRVIESSMDHRFLTSDGYKHLHQLSVGDRITANGLPALDNPDWLYKKYIEENNTLQEMSVLCGCCISYVTRALRKHGINKPLSMRKNHKPGHGKKGMFSESQKQDIAARQTGDTNSNWRGNAATQESGRARARRKYEAKECWGCGMLDPLERHHADGNPLNNEEDNIIVLCQKCHKAFHLGQAVRTVFEDEITTITPLGVQPTYDLVMLNEPHNFVANGVVVHNSTRYCNYSADGSHGMNVIKPFFFPEDEKKTPITWVDGSEQLSNRFMIWHYAMKQAEWTYNALLASGASPQEARSVLPNSLKTKLKIKANVREWWHIFKLRAVNTGAHPQAREAMIPALDACADQWPVLFDWLREDLDRDLLKKARPKTGD